MTIQLPAARIVNYTRPKSGKVCTQAEHARAAQKQYERHLTLARAKALAGDQIETENYYQYADTISADEPNTH